MPTLHPYTIHCAGQKVTVLAPTAWHALDHGMIIFGHLGGISVKRQGAAGGADQDTACTAMNGSSGAPNLCAVG